MARAPTPITEESKVVWAKAQDTKDKIQRVIITDL